MLYALSVIMLSNDFKGENARFFFGTKFLLWAGTGWGLGVGVGGRVYRSVFSAVFQVSLRCWNHQHRPHTVPRFLYLIVEQ